MEIDTSVSGAPMPSVAGVVALKQSQVADAVSVAMLKKQLDLQQEIASQFFQSMGIGQNVDATA